ncbi:MAG: hypothetical protein V1851_00250 [Patescibacteria group bacterium]
MEKIKDRWGRSSFEGSKIRDWGNGLILFMAGEKDFNHFFFVEKETVVSWIDYNGTSFLFFAGCSKHKNDSELIWIKTLYSKGEWSLFHIPTRKFLSRIIQKQRVA